MLDCIDGLVGVVKRNVEMGDGADRLWSEGQHQNAFVSQPVAELSCGTETLVHTEEEQIGIDLLRCKPKVLNRGDPRSKSLGTFVVESQAINMILKGMERGSSGYATLTHSASEDFSMAQCFVDQFTRSGESRSDGRTETLAEADADRVEVLGPGGCVDTGGDDSVE